VRLTAAQKVKIRRAVAELAADYITDSWGEPLKDVDQSRHWPATPAGMSEDEQDQFWGACNDYLDTAARTVAKHIKGAR
jgi:hypothetical protein